MPAKKDRYWVERVLSIKGQNETWGQERIERALDKEAEEKNLTGSPSTATIGRILRREWKTLSPEKKAQYRLCYWPESMERGDLPWDASASALELLGLRSWRHTIRVAKWFWRVSMAAPDLSAEQRLDLAMWFVSREAGGRYETEEIIRGVEGYLRCAPWRSDQNKQRYDEASENGIVPPLPVRKSGVYGAGEKWIPFSDRTIGGYIEELEVQHGEERE